jgi:hypothetical protein
MERESTGTKIMAANCEGSQRPPRTVELRKRKKSLIMQAQYSILIISFYTSNPLLETIPNLFHSTYILRVFILMPFGVRNGCFQRDLTILTIQESHSLAGLFNWDFSIHNLGHLISIQLSVHAVFLASVTYIDETASLLTLISDRANCRKLTGTTECNTIRHRHHNVTPSQEHK